MGGTDAERCWICGGVGPLSREHIMKRTDLVDVFGAVTQENPLYLHDGQRSNQRIRSVDAKRLKSDGRICVSCNSARTQPHDDAWTTFSRTLRARLPAMRPGQMFRASSVFPYETSRRMREVHLYFVKLFGCHVAAYGIPIDLVSFRHAILSGTPHPNVYLKFGFGPSWEGEPHTGTSDIRIAQTARDGVAFANWFHSVGGLSVLVMFALPGESREGMVNAWHPRSRNNLKIADFRGRPPGGEREAN